MEVDTSRRVTPGQELAHASRYVAGNGTTVSKDRIYSTLVGTTHIIQSLGNAQATLSVVRLASRIATAKSESADASIRQNLLPQVGEIVLARVTRISRLQANAQILVVGETALVEDFQGVIRTADVRAHEVDKVKIATSFRAGDIIRAEVISLGDQSSYFLSTAKNELGVLFAWNELGEMMSPLSWNQMESESGAVEERKVAKPFV